MKLFNLITSFIVLFLSLNAGLLFLWELKRAGLCAPRERRAVRRQNVSDILERQNRRDID